MKNPIPSWLRLGVQWFRSTRRIRKEQPIPAEQLRAMLLEMFSDPETRRLLLPHLASVYPIQGGACAYLAKDVGPGQFGSDPSCGGGDYSFPAKLGIGTTTPSAKLQLNDTNRFSGTSNPSSVLTLGNMTIVTTDTQGADVGAILALGGNRGTTNGQWVFGGVRGAKENSTGDHNSGYLGFYTLQTGVAFAERMRITSTGNVGIGTTTPERNCRWQAQGSLRAWWEPIAGSIRPIRRACGSATRNTD
ncbi:MAG: hypothetical protein HY647_00530 [Acidobacteria bacterium]|nr:hypothetical protein [Acidobacteriota bacterium]